MRRGAAWSICMKTFRVVVAHSRYRERGGEDAVVDAEIALLRAHGHEVSELRRENCAMEQLAAHQQLQHTVWSAAAVRELNDVIRDRRPDVIHVHNTFPSLSPAIYWAAAAAGVPVVQTLHNFRLFCVQAMFL